MSLMKLTAMELGAKLKSKEVSTEEAVTATLDQIHQVEDTDNSYVTVLDEAA